MKISFATILASGDSIVPFIVFAVIIAGKILKSIKSQKDAIQVPNQQEESRQPARPAASPQDELQNFLNSLAGIQPTPPPEPKPAIKPVKKAPKPVSQVKPRTPPTPVSVKEKKAPYVQKAKIARQEHKAHGVHKRQNTSSDNIRIEVGLDLIKKSSLQKALVLREILGAPIALRNKDTMPGKINA